MGKEYDKKLYSKWCERSEEFRKQSKCVLRIAYVVEIWQNEKITVITESDLLNGLIRERWYKTESVKITEFNFDTIDWNNIVDVKSGVIKWNKITNFNSDTIDWNNISGIFYEDDKNPSDIYFKGNNWLSLAVYYFNNKIFKCSSQNILVSLENESIYINGEVSKYISCFGFKSVIEGKTFKSRKYLIE